jgi:hypothetical protein
MDTERICLLDICPPNPGQVQRRVIEVNVDGEIAWREFEVVRVFEDEREAMAFAVREGIADIDL